MADSKEGPTKVTMSSNAPSDDGAEVKDHSMGRFSSIELPYSATSPEQSAKT
ncbi:hypothetical protein LTR49_023896 [Elasticomyces elasticus]|nr:hypothetical protein LTR49_023896 [Elasticomyces elasticus]